jgi:ABC-type amino acid transport substrate-binding protein
MMRALTRRAAIGSGLCLLATRPGAALAAPDALARIKAAGVIRIGTSGSAPPYTGVDFADRLTGYDIAWGDLIAHSLEIRADWVKIDFRGLMLALQSGQVDALMSGIRITPAREKVFAFSIPYSYEATVAVAPVAHPGLSRFADIASHRIDVVAGSFQEQVARAVPGVTSIAALPSASDVFMSLRTGHADAAVLGMSAIAHYRHAGNTDMVVIGQGAAPTPQGIVMRLDEPSLKAAIDRVILAKIADGTYRDLYLQYFQQEPPVLGSGHT